MTSIFAADLTLDEIRQLRVVERLLFRNQSYNGQFGIPTLKEYIDIALGAGRPVGIYPGKPPTRAVQVALPVPGTGRLPRTWHMQLV
jgi:glycerophosphoryl diester phosphodiesterase